MPKSKLPAELPDHRSLSHLVTVETLTSMLKFYQTEYIFIKVEYDRARLNRQYVKRSYYEGQMILCKSVTLDLISIIDDL